MKFTNLFSFFVVCPLVMLSTKTTTTTTNAMVGPFTDDIIEYLYARSICNSDDSVEAKCYEDKTQIYKKSKAALRIQKNRRAHCTGWLVGDEGHILTNNHCIANQKEADMMVFEAMAEGETCSTKCDKALGCPGVMINTPDQPVKFLATGGSLQHDWTLLQLPLEIYAAVVAKYGYLTLRRSGAVKEEEIYIPQHPRGYGKKIAMKDGTSPATIIDIDSKNFNGCGISQVAYKADTQGGSSGSPVIAVSDNAVIAIHHCGGCSTYGNSATNMDSIINGTKSFLPNSAYSTADDQDITGGSWCSWFFPKGSCPW